ncbi:MAG: flagellar biosynthesis anti-sigma factor FlgM [Pseudohongiellaceae bacterium]|jgi:flagellar biosynthesis anti-sigma factor FlgM
MSIDINQISSNRPEGPKRHDNGKVAAAPLQDAENKPTTNLSKDSRDSVSLSSTAQNLAKIEVELKSLSEVDQAKVDVIKARVDSGDYQVNSQNLAQKLLDTEV